MILLRFQVLQNAMFLNPAAKMEMCLGIILKGCLAGLTSDWLLSQLLLTAIQKPLGICPQGEGHLIPISVMLGACYGLFHQLLSIMKFANALQSLEHLHLTAVGCFSTVPLPASLSYLSPPLLQAQGQEKTECCPSAS